MRTKTVLWLLAAFLVADNVAAQGWEYRPVNILLRLSAPFKPALDEARIGAADDTLYALVEGRLVTFSREAGGPKKRLALELPKGLRDLASASGAMLVLPYGKDGLWILHRPSQQWWRWQDGEWLGPKPVPGRFFGATALADGRLVVNYHHHGTYAFAIMALDGSIGQRFGERVPARLTALEGVANSWLLATDKDKIIAAHAYVPLVRVYGRDGKLQWERRYSPQDESAHKHAAAELEAEIKVNPETCCVEARMPRLATALVSNGREILVRNGLDRSFERWTLKGDQLERVRLVGAEDPWVTSGMVSLGEDLLAYEKDSLRFFRPARIVRPLTGYVRNEDGGPIAQASVVVSPAGGQVFSQRSGEDGKFSFLSIDRSLDGKVQVEAPGYLRVLREGSLAELVTEIVLTKAPSVCVTATDEDGRGISGISVTVSKRTTSFTGVQAETGPSLDSGEEEQVCISAAFPLPWLLRVSAAGYAIAEHSVSEPGAVTVALEKEAPLSLVVTNQREEPVAGAAIVIERADDPELRDRVVADDRSIITDEKGAAVAHGLAAESYRLTIEHEDYVRLTLVVDLPLRQEPLEVKLKDGATAQISVVDAASQRPIEGAEVQIDPLGHQVPQRLACKTDASGRCSVQALPVGRFEVYATAPGRARGRQNLEVGPEDRVVSKTIKVSAGVRLQGQVQGSERYPNTRLKVELSRPGAPVASAMVSDRGEFLMESVPSGRASVWVEDAATKGALLYRIVEIPDVGEHVLTLELPIPINVSGHVKDRGQPCGSCSVVFTRLGADIGPPEISAVVTMAGRYSARLTSTGRYRVAVKNTQDGREAILLLDVSSDMEKDVALDSAHVTVAVSDRTGLPVERTTVQAFNAQDGVLMAQGLTDLEGRVSLALSGGDEIRVTAVHGNRTASETVRVGENTPLVRLILGDPNELELIVVDANTSLPLPAISARVIASGRTAYFARLTPGESGFISIPRIDNSSQTLVVQATGYAVKTVTVSSAETRARLALIPGGRSFLVKVDRQLGSPCAIELRRITGQSVALSGDSLPGPVPFFAEQAMFNMIEPGEYLVILHLCSGESAQQPVSLYPGTTPVVLFAP